MRRFVLWAIVLLTILNIVGAWGTDAVFGWLAAIAAWAPMLIDEETARVRR